MNEEEKYITLDTEQCKWWVNHLFSIAKEQACNSHNFDDGEEIQSAQDKIIKLLDQQPSDDCISRTQAIEWIENLRQIDKCFGNYEDDYFPLSEVIDRLKNVPPVTPTQRWILVSEMLQKESDGAVLITVNGEVNTGRYSEFSNTWYKGDMRGVGGDDPIAWQPLPQPYEEKSGSENE